MRKWLGRRSALLFLLLTAVGLAGGGAAALAGAETARDVVWLAAAGTGLGYALWATAASVRRGRRGVDVIAVLALAGAIAVRELLAAAVIAVMLPAGARWKPGPPNVPSGTCMHCWRARHGPRGGTAARRWRRCRSPRSCPATC